MKHFIFAIVACSIISPASMALPQKRAIRRVPMAPPPAPPPYDPNAYAKSIEGVNCANVASRAQSLVPAEPIFKRMIDKFPYGTPEKDEFETGDAYVNRVAASYKALFGDTLVVIARLPIKDFFRYNADAQEVSLEFLSDAPSGFLGIKAFSDLADVGSYNGQNAYGATARVTKEVFTQFYMDLKLHSPTVYGGAPAMKFNLPPEAARSLKATGTILVAGAYYPPFLKLNRAHSSATISDPSDTTYMTYRFTMVGSCLVVENNGQDIAHFKL